MIPMLKRAAFFLLTLPIFSFAKLYGQENPPLDPVVIIEDETGNTGAGFLVGEKKNELFIVTAAHVLGISNSIGSKVRVTFHDVLRPQVSGVVVQSDPAIDIAIIIAPKPQSYKVPKSYSIEQGELSLKQEVFAIGHPINREWYMNVNSEISEVYRDFDDRFFYIDPNSIDNGMSGGPVIESKKGKLLGIVLSKDKYGAKCLRAGTIERILTHWEVSVSLMSGIENFRIKDGRIVLANPPKSSSGLPSLVLGVHSIFGKEVESNNSSPLAANELYFGRGLQLGFEYNERVRLGISYTWFVERSKTISTKIVNEHSGKYSEAFRNCIPGDLFDSRNERVEMVFLEYQYKLKVGSSNFSILPQFAIGAVFESGNRSNYLFRGNSQPAFNCVLDGEWYEYNDSYSRHVEFGLKGGLGTIYEINNFPWIRPGIHLILYADSDIRIGPLFKFQLDVIIPDISN